MSQLSHNFCQGCKGQKSHIIFSNINVLAPTSLISGIFRSKRGSQAWSLECFLGGPFCTSKQGVMLLIGFIIVIGFIGAPYFSDLSCVFTPEAEPWLVGALGNLGL